MVSGCGTSSKKIQDLTFSTKEFSIEGCVGEDCAKVNINWPIASESELGNKMNNAILGNLRSYFNEDTTYSDLESAAKDFVKSYEEFKKDFPDASGAWEIEITSEKSYESDSLISIKFSEFNFSGGAHPNSSINFLNFDKRNGDILSEEQIVLNKKNLLEMTENAFREYHQVPNNVSLSEDGRFFLPETGFFLPNAIGYEEGKLKLIYIPYEIGPYSLGYTELEFDLSELEGIVKK
jgi:hypothetical protein